MRAIEAPTRISLPGDRSARSRQAPSPSDWRTPGCTAACELRPTIVPGLLGPRALVLHDPLVHERYGQDVGGGGSPPLARMFASGPLRFDRRSLLLTVDSVPIALSGTELWLLRALLDADGAALAKDTLLLLGWGPEYVGYHHVLRVAVTRLRLRLGAAGGLIETIRDVGYRLCLVAPGRPAPVRAPNPRALAPSGRWARDHDACVRCGSVARAHAGHGVCRSCAKRGTPRRRSPS